MEYIYSPLAKGINSVNCNPAGIMNISTFEISIGYASKIDMPDTLATFIATDEDLGEMGGDENPLRGGVYYTDDPNDTATFETRNFDLTFDYLHGGGVTDLGFGFKLGENLAFGVSRRRPTAWDMGFSGDLPAIFKGTVDFRGQTIEALTITATGYAVYDDGVNPPISTAQPLWSGFITQEDYSVLETEMNMTDQVMDKEELMFTLGTKTGPVQWGVNFIPISSTVSFNNTTAMTASAEGGDMKYWVPLFTDYTSAAAWITNELYTKEAGYANLSIIVPADQKVYNIQVAGDYSADMIRMDLGMLWQVNDNFSIGAALENVSGEDLVFRGKGLISTAETYLTGEEPPTFEAGGGVFRPFTSEAKPIEDTESWELPQEYVIQVPRKLRIGAAMKQPFIFAVDYERYLDDIKEGDLTISDLSFLRLGGEMRILFLPIVLKGDSRWLLKPTITGITDPEQEKNINDLFATMPAIPTEIYLGLSFPLFGYDSGFGVRENHASILSMYSGRLLDFLKTISYDIYLRQDSWDITYTAVAEPFYNISGNTSLVEKAQSDEEISFTDVKSYWTQSIQVTFRF
ncbi:hypothetical protein AMJ44_03925 [candidate division WOR-1 bacterium DG_54_3]|uniref:Uncharacterized protein n=1 Tax=candidate division WOR-1 bacterium DG_54_3 TaxID=1703775 RepID=A0A0S7Y3Q7_UNCSA|nr:MAG: hypothetical protein AMJ44_03925 [candidate division WOR-1 bacterium DG_54_3]